MVRAAGSRAEGARSGGSIGGMASGWRATMSFAVSEAGPRPSDQSDGTQFDIASRSACFSLIWWAEIALCFSPQTKQLCANPQPGLTQPTEELK